MVTSRKNTDNAIAPLVRIGKWNTSLSFLIISFKFQFVWLQPLSLKLHILSKNIISGFIFHHHHDFPRYHFKKANQPKKAVNHNERKKIY